MILFQFFHPAVQYVTRVLMALILGATALHAAAADGGKSSIDWKLSAARYVDSIAGGAMDTNLRGSMGTTTFWMGYYSTLDGLGSFRQARAGFEQSIETPLGRVVPSVQLAGGGFVNYSLNFEAGRSSIRPLFGISRTNEKRFFNINFDPNDSIQFGVAADLPDGRKLLGFAVRDDRINIGQQVLHLVYREPFQDGRRFMIDLFNRTGRLEDSNSKISSWGAGLTYEVTPFALRLVYDPKVNFTSSNMWRLTGAYRF